MKKIVFSLLTILIFSCGYNKESSQHIMSPESAVLDLSARAADGDYGGNMPYTEEETAEPLSEPAPEPEKDEPATRPALDEVTPEKIIKEGEVSMEVADYATYKSQAGGIIKKHKGFISSENETNDRYQITNTYTIRVPNANFEALVEELTAGDHRVDYRRMNARDVTEEYYDVATRLKTKKEIEKRYIEFLKQAKNIEEVLMVERELRVLREEIEAREGRLRFLDDRVSFSTLTLYVYQTLDYTYQPSPMPSFWQRIVKALHSGWKGLLNFIIGLTYAWPFILIILAALWLVRRWWRRRKARKMAARQ